MEMRELFASELDKLMEKNENIVIINADLAKPNGFGKLPQKYPERAINVGVAEQNMACVAAGMSSYGFIPFICTFAPFATRRICDQIAISICYAKQNVKIIGTDPGISAEYNGGTHMSFEDIGVLYIRMFRKTTPDIFDEGETFNLFNAKTIKTGADVSIFCTGIMVSEVLEANKILEEMGINAEIINIHTIKPLDEESVINSAKKTGAVVVAENHNIIGGLRSAIVETLSENYPVPVRAVGVRDVFGQVGKMPFLKETYNMTATDIVKAVESAINNK